MDDQQQFHMTIVTRKRRSDPLQPAAPASENAGHSAHSHHSHGDGQGHHSSGSGAHHSHRHYQDYGTVDLGSLKDSHPAPETCTAPGENGVPAAEAPDRELTQREFLEKYSPVLDRKYRKRSRSKFSLPVILIVVLLAVALLLAFLLPGKSGAGEGAPETLEALDTVDVAAID